MQHGCGHQENEESSNSKDKSNEGSEDSNDEGSGDKNNKGSWDKSNESSGDTGNNTSENNEGDIGGSVSGMTWKNSQQEKQKLKWYMIIRLDQNVNIMG